MNNQIYKGIGTGLQGFYKVAIVDGSTSEVKWQQEEWKKNLILNQGMEQVYSSAIVDLMKYGICGQGSRPNNIDSSTSQITQSGATVFLNVRTGLTDFTSSGGTTYPAVVQIGDVIQYSDNSESRVTAVTNGFNLQVTPSYTFTNGKGFVIWKTSQAGLESEVSRAGTGIVGTQYLVGAGNCGSTDSTVVGNVRTHRRTYDFAVESIQTTYNEVGVGWATSLASTVFSRILLDSPIIIDSGYRLRLVYDLQTTWNPASASYKTASIGGWPVLPSTNTIGSESIQVFLTSTVQVSDGASITSTALLDPYFTSDSSGTPVSIGMFASPTTTVLQTFGSAAARDTNGAYTTTMTKTAYVVLSSFVDKTGTLSVSQINRSDIRSVGFGRYSSGASLTPYSATDQGFCFLFNQSQTKDSSQTLSFTFRTTWSRILE